MKIVQMQVTKAFLDKRGLPVGVGITADLRECDDIGRSYQILRQMLEAKIAPAPIVYQAKPEPTDRKPSKEQWFRLRQLLIRKKRIDSDSDIFEYLTAKFGVEDIEMVSAEEVENLIEEIENN